MITESSRLIFGKHKGTKLKDCPDSYLQWMAQNLLNTDFHDWARVAKTIIEQRKRDNTQIKSLEDQADTFLRDHGIDPRKL